MSNGARVVTQPALAKARDLGCRRSATAQAPPLVAERWSLLQAHSSGRYIAPHGACRALSDLSFELIIAKMTDQ